VAYAWGADAREAIGTRTTKDLIPGWSYLTVELGTVTPPPGARVLHVWLDSSAELVDRDPGNNRGTASL
jgi:hypothetical protein